MRARAAVFALLAAVAVTTAACTHGTRPAVGGAHVDGLRHGPWRIARPGGSVEEGCYVAGRLHGEWVLRDPAGRIAARERWCHGRTAGSESADGEDDSCGEARFGACGRLPAP